MKEGVLCLLTKNPPNSMKKRRRRMASRLPREREGVKAEIAKFIALAARETRMRVTRKYRKEEVVGFSPTM